MRIYVSGPYTKPDPVENTHKAIQVGNRLRDAGHFPFIPHLTLLWHSVTPKPYDFWMEYDFEWVKACDAVLRMPGESSGADREVALAEQLGIPVFYSEADLLEGVLK